MAGSPATKLGGGGVGGGRGGRSSSGFGSVDEDVLESILRRLPATTFASAACVSRSWHRVCGRILSRPKLATALSLDPCAQSALQEVVDKVLAEPICPHFAIVNVGNNVDTTEALQYIGSKLGAGTPIVISADSGIIGVDVLTNQVKEVEGGIDIGSYNNEDSDNAEQGIVLTVGFVPGLKVDVVPLLHLAEVNDDRLLVDKFVTDIMEYSVAVSGCSTPVGVIMFGDGTAEIKSAAEKLVGIGSCGLMNQHVIADYAMPLETAIVGDEKGNFEYRSVDKSRYISAIVLQNYTTSAVALVFAKDRHKRPGLGDIKFHVALSDGLSTIGPRHRAASVQVDDCCTLLTARREGQEEILDGEGILNDIRDELENRVEYPDVYIGVTKRRIYEVGAEKAKLMSFLSFHGVMGGVEYLRVEGSGIESGDSFQFYYSDPAAALDSCQKVSARLRSLNLGSDSDCSDKMGSIVASAGKPRVFGGFIFSSFGRGESFFNDFNVDSSPFVENFPGVPVAGIFCGGEIGRCSPSLNVQDSEEETSVHRVCHVYSTVYLVMSYTPAPPGTAVTS
ncbi:F-box/LRR-repeat protein At5g63520-like isoform X1 [Syzygium oleosum]|uniref:F-box/LRR-repeat protein At5g63520-like isoform X1 n=1 Tax=Syzygium oleosum TaxID=219896 RepID=UPI0011D1B351|nr:F-box/LRR-repeat protein At5g63520-like isoform X1 [Syzygium oleosum]